MSKERKALVVDHTPGQDSPSLAILNTLLNDDWRLMSTTSMGATGASDAPRFAALVVLEREERKTVGGFTAG